MRKIFILAFFLTLCSGATLFGEIYDADTFKSLENVRIRIDGPLSTQLVADKNYSIEIPQGNYTIMASYFKDGKLDLITEEKITIAHENIRFDLVLLPAELAGLIPHENNTDEKPIQIEPTPFPSVQSTDNTLIVILLAVIVLVVVLIVGYLVYAQLGSKKTAVVESKKEEIKREDTPKAPLLSKKEENVDPEEELPLDEDTKKVIEVLKTSGGRMLQKELRDIMKVSESSMSLILSELEHMEYIKRFKRGRENLVKLVKEPPK